LEGQFVRIVAAKRAGRLPNIDVRHPLIPQSGKYFGIRYSFR
jgi:hypothetical protein